MRAMKRKRRTKRRQRARRDTGFSKKDLWKQIDADQRRANRAKLEALRQKLREQRSLRASTSTEARTYCRGERAAATERARAIRAHFREEARKAIAREKADARGRCVDKRSSHATTTARLRAELRAERKHQQELRAIERANRARSRARPGVAKARERRSESDDEVRSNIPSELLPLFERVKRSIKGNARMSRTEAFLRYVEEHPGEEYAGIDDKTDALVRELERQQRAGRRDWGRRTERKARRRP